MLTAEPTAMTEAYASIKMLGWRQRRVRVRLIVNRTAQHGEGDAVNRQLQRVVDRFVTAPAGAAGGARLPRRGAGRPGGARVAARRRLLLEALPDSPAAQAVAAIAQRLAA